MFLKKKTKKSSVVKRLEEYSYFPMMTTTQIELRRNIRERLVRA